MSFQPCSSSTTRIIVSFVFLFSLKETGLLLLQQLWNVSVQTPRTEEWLTIHLVCFITLVTLFIASLKLRSLIFMLMKALISRDLLDLFVILVTTVFSVLTPLAQKHWKATVYHCDKWGIHIERHSKFKEIVHLFKISKYHQAKIFLALFTWSEVKFYTNVSGLYANILYTTWCASSFQENYEKQNLFISSFVLKQKSPGSLPLQMFFGTFTLIFS